MGRVGPQRHRKIKNGHLYMYIQGSPFQNQSPTQWNPPHIRLCYRPAVFSHHVSLHLHYCGPGSSVGITTHFGLDGPGPNPGGDAIFRQSRPALGPTQYNGYRVFPGVKCGRGVLLTTHPLLVPRSWKSRAKPLPTLWVTPGL
jgi:hypothetical protein